MYRVKAGKYRLPIVIQQRTTTQDSYGQSTEVWTTFATTRAGIFPVNGDEKFEGDIITAEMTHKVHIRYIANVKSSMRISYNGRLLYIYAISNIEERNVELQLMCSEIAK